MWILLTLLVILVLSSMYREYSIQQDHLKCKESMLQQMFQISASLEIVLLKKTINDLY